MLNLKKTAVAVLALGSSAVFAGTMGPVCSAVNVTIPCESTAWDFGAQALYLQPASAGSNYTGTYTQPTGEVTYIDTNPQYSWGFKVEGSYHFNTGNDINLNWYRVQRSTSKTMSGTIAAGTATGFTSATSTLDPSWNAVNLELGQRVDFGDMKAIRFHGGVGYVRIANNTTFNATGPSAVANLNSDASYNGFGPRLGADMAYGWGNGLGMYANAATALFVGPSGFSDTFTSSVAGTSGTRSASSNIVVPELEAKLGATYTYAMAQGDLILDAGWMWVNYFDANLKDTHSWGSTTSGNTGPDTKNFSLQGPFFGLKWIGNVV